MMKPRFPGDAKPDGYPFLRIAQRFDLDYGDVLLIAQFWDNRNEGNANFHEHAAIARASERAGWSEFVKVMHAAIREQTAVREGRIDWQTGLPLETPDPDEMDYGDGRERF